MSDVKSSSYWIGHGFTILSTIMGVYLAASVGFKKAIDLEVMQADRGTYYVAYSLLNELQFNIDNMDNYIKKTQGKPYVIMEDLRGIAINEFVFESSRFNDGTFEIDPALLKDMSSYYFNIKTALEVYNKATQKSPASLITVVKRENQKAKELKIIERFTAYTSTLQKNIESRYDINLEQPEYLSP